MMLEELQRRNFSHPTVKTYLKVMEDFARHFHRPPDQLGKEHIRTYQVRSFTSCQLYIVVYTLQLETFQSRPRERCD
jgi:integrase/recombinase XerD